MPPPPPRSTLFPYTTLFRSRRHARIVGAVRRVEAARVDRAAEQHVVDPVRAPDRQALGEQEAAVARSEEHTSELQSPCNLVCRLLLEKKKNKKQYNINVIKH